MGKQLLGAGFVVALAAAGPAFAQVNVGVSAAVNPATQATPPGLAPRPLVVGADIAFRETIDTSNEGQAQLLFLDRSSLTIGPASDVTIDEFVYDRSQGAGRLVARTGKGVFRFVGGALSKNDGGVTIRTPTATIGIRGGIALLSVAEGGTVEATLLFGDNITLTAADGRAARLTRPGYSVTFDPARGRFTAPAPAADIGGRLARFDGRNGLAGGAPERPTDQRVARSGLGPANSAAPRGPTPAPAAGRGGSPPRMPPGGLPLGLLREDAVRGVQLDADQGRLRVIR